MIYVKLRFQSMKSDLLLCEATNLFKKTDRILLSKSSTSINIANFINS